MHLRTNEYDKSFFEFHRFHSAKQHSSGGKSKQGFSPCCGGYWIPASEAAVWELLSIYFPIMIYSEAFSVICLAGRWFLMKNTSRLLSRVQMSAPCSPAWSLGAMGAPRSQQAAVLAQLWRTLSHSDNRAKAWASSQYFFDKSEATVSTVQLESLPAAREMCAASPECMHMWKDLFIKVMGLGVTSGLCWRAVELKYEVSQGGF